IAVAASESVGLVEVDVVEAGLILGRGLGLDDGSAGLDGEQSEGLVGVEADGLRVLEEGGLQGDVGPVAGEDALPGADDHDRPGGALEAGQETRESGLVLILDDDREGGFRVGPLGDRLSDGLSRSDNGLSGDDRKALVLETSGDLGYSDEADA